MFRMTPNNIRLVISASLLTLLLAAHGAAASGTRRACRLPPKLPRPRRKPCLRLAKHHPGCSRTCTITCTNTASAHRALRGSEADRAGAGARCHACGDPERQDQRVPVDLYRIDGEALPGQPVTLHLAAIPRVAGVNLHVSTEAR